VSPDRLTALAAAFWERLPAPAPPFPRDLEPVLSAAAPVWVVAERGLTTGAVRRWLHGHGLGLPVSLPDRRLDGCILAFQGTAVLFVREGLPADERRVVVAHEFAHYLADYELPREQARRRLGAAVLPLLDGARPVLPVEGWAAALAGVKLEAHAHYMARSYDPGRRAATDRVEARANALACELLAPRLAVRTEAHRRGFALDDRSGSRGLLAEAFGLPSRWANAYARQLLIENRRRRSFCDRVGL
jgi:IrrE N-terminal-like domain